MSDIRSDGWLSEVMGRPVFRLDPGPDPDLTLERLRAVQGHIREQEYAFYYAKVPTTQVETLRRLSSVGFQLVDTNLILELTRLPQMAGEPAGCTIEVGAPVGDSGVLDIA